MKRSLVTILLLMLLSANALAHEYWLEPATFFLPRGKSIPIRMYLGEGLKVEEERPFQASKTSIFKMFSADGPFDFAGQSRDGLSPILNFSSERPGTFMLAMDRGWSYVTLDAEKFEDYLREDGIEYIIDERQKLSERKKEGKERYSRYLKSLLLVGDKKDKTFGSRTGLKLEILPLENPYAKRVGDSLSFQVLFDGKPLANRTVFADNRDGETLAKRKFTTDKNGSVTVKLERKGVWMVRLVHMRRCEKNCEGADWESFWGSLTFGVR